MLTTGWSGWIEYLRSHIIPADDGCQRNRLFAGNQPRKRV
jgi:hypothetical protein